MPKEWVAVNALTIEERQKIKEAIDMNMSYSEMGEYVGRDKSTVMREAKRLGHFSQYDPNKAQKDFESKQKLVGIKRNSPLYLKIKEEENLG